MHAYRCLVIGSVGTGFSLPLHPLQHTGPPSVWQFCRRRGIRLLRLLWNHWPSRIKVGNCCAGVYQLANKFHWTFAELININSPPRVAQKTGDRCGGSDGSQLVIEDDKFGGITKAVTRTPFSPDSSPQSSRPVQNFPPHLAPSLSLHHKQESSPPGPP
jgi:hypothetical protein